MQTRIPDKTNDATIKLIPSKNFRGAAGIAVRKANTVSQNIWHQLRSPFLLPVNCCGVCVWEPIEYGKMGCRRCGGFHICCITTCHVTEIENNQVCTITGTVLKTITYDSNEYLTTASHDPFPVGATCKSLRQKYSNPSDTKSTTKSNAVVTDSSVFGASSTTAIPTPIRLTRIVSMMANKKHTVSQCINFHERVCLQVLCSEITTQCYEKERIKLRNRLRWSFMRHIRAFKLKHRDIYPNCIVLLSSIAVDIENYRLPITNDTMATRKELAYICASDIFKFTCSMMHSNAAFTTNMDPTTMVIGLLYLLRSGLIHKNMTVLPQHRPLAYLLPPENYINMFGVKSKIITECENIVKCHLRTLSDRVIKDIGYEAFERLVQ
jgi:hypothetical protein